MHGKGTYTYKNGRRYEGQWFAGYKQGFGRYYLKLHTNKIIDQMKSYY